METVRFLWRRNLGKLASVVGIVCGFSHNVRKHRALGTCNANCLQAREIKCVCSCHGRNHGRDSKRDITPLDAIL